MIIAIDGPAGSGKSTISKKVAQKLKFTYLDTGAMYRAATLRAFNKGIDFSNEAAIVDCVERSDIKLLPSFSQKQRVFLDGKEVSDKIRDPEITRLVKHVAKLPKVREHLVALQKAFSESNHIVAEGRDTTTVVFPDAYLKIYLDGNQEERARRRFVELQENGMAVTFEEILNDQKERDQSDFEREAGPLKKAEDAVVVDTSDLTIDEVTNAVVMHYKKRWWDNHNLVYSFFRPCFMIFLKLCYGFRAYGYDNILSETGVIIASNHASFLDPIILGVGASRQLSFMAKNDLFKRKFLGWLISLVNVYPVNREKADPHALTGGVKMIQEKKAVVIFPEGTRSLDGNVKPAKKFGLGFIACRTGCPVVPAYIKGSFKAFPKGSKRLHRSKVSVTFGVPLFFDDIEGNGKDRYRLATEKVMNAIVELEGQHKNESRSS
ncbi:(d)CMP kinase [Candidatus Omnitrophota bacterium]